ncbi:hypothetical protein [Rhabdaerophilum sp. SD176]|uniref:hypothetical protein n=1 Tax=Rhabdaerophilum sp. SD176 TaxID=2983548 RepID=UPI0024E02690|nr:hypothetical protein [Rhabdaerophilum sp. SD176]
MNPRKAILLAGFMALGAPAGAQEPRDEPREIVRLIAWRYTLGPPPDPASLPLVDRLLRALARADIDGDVVMRNPENRMEQAETGWSQRIDHQRVRLVLRFREKGQPGEVEFLFDRASGPWLITDIRNRDGRSLRKLLQIPAPL